MPLSERESERRSAQMLAAISCVHDGSGISEYSPADKDVVGGVDGTQRHWRGLGVRRFRFCGCPMRTTGYSSIPSVSEGYKNDINYASILIWPGVSPVCR